MSGKEDILGTEGSTMGLKVPVARLCQYIISRIDCLSV
jgi:hypothetical protein